MMRTLFILAILSTFTSSFAANSSYTVTSAKAAAAELRKVSGYYNSNNNISIDTYYMAFEDHETQKIAEGKYGKYVKSGGSSYVKILDIETLTLPDMVLTVNHSDKQIVIGDNSIPSVNPLTENLDSLLLICSEIRSATVGTSEKKFVLDFSDNEYSEYDKVELTIDTKFNRFTKISLFFRAQMNLTGDYDGVEKQPRLEIQYKNYKSSPTAIPVKEKFITEINGATKTTKAYSSYTITDLRKKSRVKGYKNK